MLKVIYNTQRSPPSKLLIWMSASIISLMLIVKKLRYAIIQQKKLNDKLSKKESDLAGHPTNLE
jgi:hypothetical protein